MRRATRTAISLGLSLAMAFGGLPAQALAESIEEVAAVREEMPEGEPSPVGLAAEEGLSEAPAEEPSTEVPSDAEAPIVGEPVGRDEPEHAAEGEAPAEALAEGTSASAVSDQDADITLTTQASTIASGEWGTCTWSIDADGLLRVSPTNGRSGQLADSRGYGTSIDQRYFPWFDIENNGRITKVRFDDGVALPANCEGMFIGCTSLASLDVSGWNTSRVENMSSMFYGCSSLSSLNLSGWDTSRVKNMSNMFASCSSLTSLDLSRWNTSRVENMTNMFLVCSSLASLDVSGWDTSNVTSMRGMFFSCSSLASLDVSGWNTSNVTSIDSMFSDCPGLSSLDVSRWDTSNVTNMFRTFSGSSSLASLDLSDWDTSSVEGMYGMFDNCSSLTSLDLSGWDTSGVTSSSYMFRDCSSLTSLDLSGWDTSGVTSSTFMFRDCSSLTRFKVGKGYAIKDAGMFPDSNASNGKWWSTAKKAWVAKDTIVSKRSDVADTYRTAGGSEKANPITAKATRASVSVTYKPGAATTTSKNVTVTDKIGTLTYANASTDAAAKGFAVDKSTGKVTLPKATRAGTYTVKVKVTAAGGPNYRAGSKTVSYKVVVNKAANPIRATAVARTASYATLRTKAVTVTKPLTVSGSIGTKTYARAQNSNYFTVDASTGKVTIKKGTPKGTYTLKVKVTAAGGPNYRAGSKTVTSKITVK